MSKKIKTYWEHDGPLLAENLTNFTCAHRLVFSRDLRPAPTRKNHKGIHRAFWCAICIQRLAGKCIGIVLDDNAIN